MMRIGLSLRNINSNFNNNYASIKNTYKLAKLESKQKNYGTTKTALNIGKQCFTKVYKEHGIDGVPIIAGIIGFLIPLPVTSVIFYAITKGIVSAVKPIIKKS